MRLEVKRSDVLFTSFQAFRGVMGEGLKKRLNIQYEGEEGIDSGGITKEWYRLNIYIIFSVAKYLH